MTQYLAIGEDMKSVTFAGPQMQTVEGGSILYDSPETPHSEAPVEAGFGSMQIIGIVDETWYHVWFYEDGSSGYFHVSDLWPGNG